MSADRGKAAVIPHAFRPYQIPLFANEAMSDFVPLRSRAAIPLSARPRHGGDGPSPSRSLNRSGSFLESGHCAGSVRTTIMVKVFGCRPSPVARLGAWPAYGNRPSTNPRGCGDGLWGFRVLLGCGDGGAACALQPARAWSVRFFAGRTVDLDLATADSQSCRGDPGERRAWGHSS